MTDLEKKNENLQTKSSGLGISSLDDLGPMEKNAGGFENLGILVDLSGSMLDGITNSWEPDPLGYDDEKPVQTKIEAARKAIASLHHITDFSVCETQAWYFETGVGAIEWEIDKVPNLPNPRGGTNMTGGLDEALRHENRNRIILISDGDANSPTTVLERAEKAKSREIVIDCIFIGPEGSAGARLLQEVAKITGGRFVTVEDTESLVTELQQLESHNRLLLGHSGDSDGNEVIKL